MKGLVLGALLAAALVFAFHDVSWYPPDDGNYAHVAERLLAGEVLHRDVMDVHAGYVDFAHALAFRVFGIRLVSLRYPLILLAVVQAVAIAWMLRRRGVGLQVVAAGTGVATGMLLFNHPSANWYALTVSLVGVALVDGLGDRSMATRAGIAGLATALAAGFRQLSGAILGAGMLVWLLTAEDAGKSPNGETQRGAPSVLARLVLAGVTAGVLGYVLWAGEPISRLLFGVPAVLVATHAALRCRLSDRETLRRCGWFSAGLVAGALPMLLYVAWTGSWFEFIDDAFLAAIKLPSVPYVEHRSYAEYLLTGVAAVASLRPALMMAGLFWLALLSTGLALGWTLARRAAEGLPPSALGAPVVVGVFWAMSAIHFPSPLYFGLTAPLVLVAIVTASRTRTGVFAAAFALLATVALAQQAGNRRSFSWLWGRGRPPSAVLDLPRGGLEVPADQARLYRVVVPRIQEGVEKDESIFAFPSHAELYFLSARSNPTPHFNLALWVRSPEDSDALVARLGTARPRLVIFDTQDPQWTDAALPVLRWAGRAAERQERIGRFVLFWMP